MIPLDLRAVEFEMGVLFHRIWDTAQRAALGKSELQPYAQLKATYDEATKKPVAHCRALRAALQTLVEQHVSPDADDQRGGYCAWCSWCDRSSYDGVAAIPHTPTCPIGSGAAVLAQATDQEGA